MVAKRLNNFSRSCYMLFVTLFFDEMRHAVCDDAFHIKQRLNMSLRYTWRLRDYVQGANGA